MEGIFSFVIGKVWEKEGSPKVFFDETRWAGTVERRALQFYCIPFDIYFTGRFLYEEYSLEVIIADIFFRFGEWDDS